MTSTPLLDWVPYVRGSSTSRAAADAIAVHVTPLQKVVMDYLREHGPSTDEEMQAGIPMGPNTQRPRRVELVRNGLIRDSGTTRDGASGKMAVVWKIA